MNGGNLNEHEIAKLDHMLSNHAKAWVLAAVKCRDQAAELRSRPIETEDRWRSNQVRADDLTREATRLEKRADMADMGFLFVTNEDMTDPKFTGEYHQLIQLASRAGRLDYVKTGPQHMGDMLPPP